MDGKVHVDKNQEMVITTGGLGSVIDGLVALSELVIKIRPKLDKTESDELASTMVMTFIAALKLLPRRTRNAFFDSFKEQTGTDLGEFV